LKGLWNVGRKLGFSSQELQDIQWLAIGPFEQVKLKIIPSELKLTQSLRKKIEKRWREHLQEHPYDFAGPMVSVSKIEIKERILTLELRRTNYKDFIGSRWKKKKRLIITKVPLDENFPLPISVGAIALTNDNEIIFWKREKVGIAEGFLDPVPAGYFNPDIDRNWCDCLRRRSLEEIGISKFLKIEVLGITLDCKISQQPMLVIRMQLPAPREKIKEKREKLVFIENKIEEVKGVIRKYSLTPHAKSQLILHFALS
jgi:hypothetical protein